jgi:hypothetical protein
VNAFLDLARSSTAMTVLVISTAIMFGVALAFLVAASWLRRSNNRKAAQWARLEYVWGSTIEDIAAGRLTPEALHQQIGVRHRLTLLDYLYKAIRDEASEPRRQLLVTLAAPYLNVLRRRAERGDVWQRARAIRTIAELGGMAGASTIQRGLDDPAPHVALTAARTYARLRLGPIEPLLDRIDRYGDWDRRLLRRTLASFGDSGTHALQAHFADPATPVSVRAVCADTLAELGFNANETAIAVLREDAHVDVHAAALRALRAPAPDAQRDVVRELCASQAPVIRAQAVACLARIGDSTDVKRLELALADISPWVVLSAFRGLGHRRN